VLKVSIVRQQTFMMKPLTICFLFLLFPSTLSQHQSTRVISGKGVFIFGPSLAEVDSMNPDESEAISDFAYYSSKIASFVRAKGIPCEYIADHKIKVQFASVKVFIVNRDSLKFGTILTDGDKEPLLLKYVLTDDELEEKCKEYFHLK